MELKVCFYSQIEFFHNRHIFSGFLIQSPQSLGWGRLGCCSPEIGSGAKLQQSVGFLNSLAWWFFGNLTFVSNAIICAPTQSEDLKKLVIKVRSAPYSVIYYLSLHKCSCCQIYLWIERGMLLQSLLYSVNILLDPLPPPAMEKTHKVKIDAYFPDIW